MADALTAGMFTATHAVFVGSSVIGMVAHYAKKWALDETTSRVHEWFGKDDLRATILTFGALGSAIIGALGAGLITPDMNMFAVIYAGLTTGFAVDSGFNRGTKPTVKPKK